MVINNSLQNIAGTLASSEILSKISSLLTILKALGVIALAYLTYLIISFFLGIKRYKRVRNIELMLKRIEKKIDNLKK